MGTNASPLLAIPDDAIVCGLELAGTASAEGSVPFVSWPPISAAANSRKKSILWGILIVSARGPIRDKRLYLHSFEQARPATQISLDPLTQFLKQDVEGVTVSKYLHDLTIGNREDRQISATKEETCARNYSPNSQNTCCRC